MTVFALMDEWIAAAGDSDSWLELGLRLAERWQAATGADPADGQPHLQQVLAALSAYAPPVQRPDAARLAAWFHHGTEPGRSVGVDAAAREASRLLTPLAGAETAARVGALVRGLGGEGFDEADADLTMLRSAHRAACRAPLAVVPGERRPDGGAGVTPLPRPPRVQ